MTDIEARCWQYLLKNRDATATDVALNCDVTENYASALMGRISSENWREPTINQQVGGSHYKDMAVQPWQAMEAWLTPEEYRGYHKGVAIGYLARERQKGGLQDIEKAIHHLRRLVETEDDRSKLEMVKNARVAPEKSPGFKVA
jgi:hypothetical protein